jgi:hypothetical protein
LECDSDGKLVSTLQQFYNETVSSNAQRTSLVQQAVDLFECKDESELIPALQHFRENIRKSRESVGCLTDDDVADTIRSLRVKLTSAEVMQLLTGSRIDVEFPLSKDDG